MASQEACLAVMRSSGALESAFAFADISALKLANTPKPANLIKARAVVSAHFNFLWAGGGQSVRR